MLTLLTRLEDLPRIEGLLAKIAAAGGYDKQDNDAIISALARLSLEKRAAIVERLIAATAEKSLSACGDLLMRAVPVLANGRNTDFVDAAVRLVEALRVTRRARRFLTCGGKAAVWIWVSSLIC
jgi:hypothetical protein